MVGKKRQQRQNKKALGSPSCSNNNDYGPIAWIDKLLQTPIDDFRKRSRDLVLFPYFVVGSGRTHDPVEWVFEFGHFDRERWRKNWQNLFDNYDYDLIRNNRETIKIEVSKEGDGAFAVVDIDTHWRHKLAGEDFVWKGRVCKIYTKMSNGEWKIIFQT